MELFSMYNGYVYFSNQSKEIGDVISMMKDEEINGNTIDAWMEYYISKYKFAMIEFVEDSIQKECEKCTMRQYNHMYNTWGGNQYYDVEGLRVHYKVPFWGSKILLFIKPSTWNIDRYNVDDIIDYKEGYSSIELTIEIKKEELMEHKEDMDAYIEKEFQKEFGQIKQMANYVNSDAMSFNNSLENNIRKSLELRKKKADEYDFITKNISIPMKRSDNAPNTKPILLKKQIIKEIPRPEIKAEEPIYGILLDDYKNINNIIFMFGTSMENAVDTYRKHSEEELRNMLLSTLNTHYDNTGGEVFRRVGKTDIKVEFDNKAAYIGECKIWHGEKMLEEAVKQILSYSTWKDSKISLIYFNKDNKNFDVILQSIDKWVEKNTIKNTKINPNRWDTTYYRKDRESEIEMSIMIFDLYNS